ncbi:MAG: hypothetical protein JO180_00115 [Gemmatirosa sp.]|nr:hypothetical protein [Gemmatirosa sp.]
MYIDPAAGSMILQLVGAGLVSILAFTKSVRRSIATGLKSIFGRRRAE